MTDVYIVEGSEGEYSDRTEWVVKGFTSEAKACELVASLSVKLAEIQQKELDDFMGDYDQEWIDLDPSHPYRSYGERRYYVYKIEVDTDD